eukprot:scaffold25730_cov22-Tisochrysis_lutea.AAC.1
MSIPVTHCYYQAGPGGGNRKICARCNQPTPPGLPLRCSGCKQVRIPGMAEGQGMSVLIPHYMVYICGTSGFKSMLNASMAVPHTIGVIPSLRKASGVLGLNRAAPFILEMDREGMCSYP